MTMSPSSTIMPGSHFRLGESVRLIEREKRVKPVIVTTPYFGDG
jgi:hypothetical protein